VSPVLRTGRNEWIGMSERVVDRNRGLK